MCIDSLKNVWKEEEQNINRDSFRGDRIAGHIFLLCTFLFPASLAMRGDIGFFFFLHLEGKGF